MFETPYSEDSRYFVFEASCKYPMLEIKYAILICDVSEYRKLPGLPHSTLAVFMRGLYRKHTVELSSLRMIPILMAVSTNRALLELFASLSLLLCAYVVNNKQKNYAGVICIIPKKLLNLECLLNTTSRRSRVRFLYGPRGVNS